VGVAACEAVGRLRRGRRAAGRWCPRSVGPSGVCVAAGGPPDVGVAVCGQSAARTQAVPLGGRAPSLTGPGISRKSGAPRPERRAPAWASLSSRGVPLSADPAGERADPVRRAQARPRSPRSRSSRGEVQPGRGPAGARSGRGRGRGRAERHATRAGPASPSRQRSDATRAGESEVGGDRTGRRGPLFFGRQAGGAGARDRPEPIPHPGVQF
jgi:hypothetical protein